MRRAVLFARGTAGALSAPETGGAKRFSSARRGFFYQSAMQKFSADPVPGKLFLGRKNVGRGKFQ
ncbi:MAG: hypothetical protein BHW65_01635 [Verrucomicrobia bacterium CAG:312_58_20]|nr:MAG: hypothetical protein BHW65_01635 [Verrucomicrobia bacterium CAG:312_58_20]